MIQTSLGIADNIIHDQPDLNTTQSEAYTILIHQVAAMGPGKVQVIPDDTNLFVLLLQFFTQVISK